MAVDLVLATGGTLLVRGRLHLALRLELLPVSLDGLDLFLDRVELARKVLLVALRLERHARNALQLRAERRLARRGLRQELGEVGLRHFEDADDGVPCRGLLG